ncbi:centriolar coiled-coil protein of 110 kDa-like [Scleropages formosus]|uniref:Centriolar coiled-coil protein of 110 kDa-like n=1 Tax=Scleropages formosus TaxID=113540 RepID=A0A0P7V301_SCLFO|nr:centriolar coiled-coil protein of 110 kDa-like [Scleropages formosus]
MVQHRLRAVQLDTERQSVRKGTSSGVRDIVEGVQVSLLTTVTAGTETWLGSDFSFVLQKHNQSPGFSFENDFSQVSHVALTSSGDTGSFFSKAEPSLHEQNVSGDAEEQVEGEKESGSPCISLQSLLKRSGEYLEKEQGHRGSWGTQESALTLTESLSDKENKSGDDVGAGVLTYSPHQSTFEPNSCPESLPGGYLRTHAGPHPHRRRPRPISTGSILSVPPISPSETSPRGPGARVPEVDPVAAPVVGSVERRLPEPLRPSDRVPSSGATGQPGSLSKTCLTWTPVPSTVGPGATPSEFRRRSNTLDSHLNPSRPEPPVDRNRERIPRMMGGVVWRGICQRSPPTPLRQTSHGAPEHSFIHITSKLDMEASQVSHKSQLTACFLNPRMEDLDSETGVVQSHVHSLKEKRWRLEEQHVRHVSLLITEQERAQERLRQLEDKERRLREHEDELVMDLGDSWNAPKEHCRPLSPSPTQFLLERSPGGNTSLLSPGLPSPGVHSPVYLWGPPAGTSKARKRLSQVLTPEQQCRLGAVVRGFLTRRLLSTEKLKHLRQTVHDTQDFIRSFQTEAPLRKGSLSAQDMALRERVKAQLRAALYDVHDIFFEMPLGDRLALLQQDRELRSERKLREMEKARSPKDRVTLSAATQKSLDRKKQRSLYRKTPEERVKHSDNMRKRHSLG